MDFSLWLGDQSILIIMIHGDYSLGCLGISFISLMINGDRKANKWLSERRESKDDDRAWRALC